MDTIPPDKALDKDSCVEWDRRSNLEVVDVNYMPQPAKSGDAPQMLYLFGEVELSAAQ